MVGVITLSPSQRGAYEPASCLRGSVVDTPQREETPAFTPGRMSCPGTVADFGADPRSDLEAAVDPRRSDTQQDVPVRPFGLSQRRR